MGNQDTPNGGSRALVESKLPRNATGLPHRGGGKPSVMVLHALGNSQDRALCPGEYVDKSTPHDPAIGYRVAGYGLRRCVGIPCNCTCIGALYFCPLRLKCNFHFSILTDFLPSSSLKSDAFISAGSHLRESMSDDPNTPVDRKA